MFYETTFIQPVIMRWLKLKHETQTPKGPFENMMIFVKPKPRVKQIKNSCTWIRPDDNSDKKFFCTVSLRISLKADYSRSLSPKYKCCSIWNWIDGIYTFLKLFVSQILLNQLLPLFSYRMIELLLLLGITHLFLSRNFFLLGIFWGLTEERIRVWHLLDDFYCFVSINNIYIPFILEKLKQRQMCNIN